MTISDTVPPYFSVRTALSLPEMRGTEVVAGAEGLDREVTGANIIEVPDVWRWLRGGELLFTTGYAWRHDPDEMVKGLSDLHRRGVSGVVFKLGTYMPELPNEVCAVADDLALPIIRLPNSVAYMDIIDRLNQQLRDPRLRMFERLHETEQQLLGLGLDEQSIERVAGVLAQEIANCVYVIDLVDDVVVIACPDGTSRTVPLEDQQEPEAAGVVSAVLPAEMPRQRSLTRQSLGAGITGLSTPLVVARDVRGVLVATEGLRPLDDLAQHTIAHGAELVSFLLLKRLANLQGQRASMALLVRSLLEDRLSKDEAFERALSFGLRLNQPVRVLAIGSPETPAPDNVENLRQDLSRILGTTPHAIGPDEDRTVVLIQAKADAETKSVDLVAERLLRIGRQHDLRGAVVGVGGAHSGLEGLRRSRLEALVAYTTRVRAGAAGVVYFSGLGVEGLLSQIPSREITDLFVRAAIGPILDDPELLRTLEVYVDSGGRKLAAAEKLPLHRSSLEYRLEKITKLLGVDLTVPERRSELWLALRLRRLSES